MRSEFYQYFERELAYLRRFGAEFGARYPAVAARLNLEPDRCDDPHVERLLEAFSFLAARIHLRLDDDFPEISGALLNVLYPQSCRPVPSMAMVQFLMDPSQGKNSAELLVKAGTKLTTTRSVEGQRCRFRTCYDTVLYPFEIEDAAWGAPVGLPPGVDRTSAILRVRLQCFPDVKFRNLKAGALRFYLSGTSELVHRLYELIHGRCHSVWLRDPDRKSDPHIPLSRGVLQPVGFEPDETLWPPSSQTFRGYQLMQEYFAFPYKFLFVDIRGAEEELARMGTRAEFQFLISPFDKTEWKQDLELGVTAGTFRLGCTPAINLFPHQPDHPIRLEQTVYEYPVVVSEKMDIYSVESVVARGPTSDREIEFERFYDMRASKAKQQPAGYWYANRRAPIGETDSRSEVVLTVVDSRGSPVEPGVDALTVRLQCMNGRLPAQMLSGEGTSDFQAELAGNLRVVCVRRPTEPAPPPAATMALWHLVSQLSLNHRSLVDEGSASLKWLLQLQNLTGAAFARDCVEGIRKLASRPHFARVDSDYGAVFVRGKRLDIELDEDRFAGSGVYLFGAVLDRFFGAYTSLNSFTELHVATAQRTVGDFPPRAGHRVVA